eukprot:TRINITY_DN6122_c1_g5_i1.p1 TRINITY_DN6122_c1_g5~~TRINITY_DN6122_c1_g5_i1.p1  ORF type:complete len:411 (+),score=50.91 TRINITY_DN6122_c1_g5_i1:34-1233(+)
MREVEYTIKEDGTYSEEVTFIVPERYKCANKVLGKGSFGSVCSAVDVETGKEVAIKRCNEVFSEGRHMAAVRELQLLNHFCIVNHPNVVTLRDFFIPSGFTESTFNDVYLVMDRYDTSLRGFLNDDDELASLDIIKRKSLIRQLLRGLHSIHLAGFVHRDIKPENLLIKIHPETGKIQLVICDFGSGRVPDFTTNNPTAITLVTSMAYMPPEGIVQVLDLANQQGEEYNVISQGTQAHLEQVHAPEIWGVGCIMWELITGDPLVSHKKSPIDILKRLSQVLGPPPASIANFAGPMMRERLMSTPPVTIKEYFTDEQFMMEPEENPFGSTDVECDLLSAMLAYLPEERCSIPESLGHEYFHGLPDEPIPEVPKFTNETPSKLSVDTARAQIWELVKSRAN